MRPDSEKIFSETLDIVSHSIAQTRRFGRYLGEILRSGDIVLLEGDLGAGKTSLTQGIAEGLGVSEVVNSPTFTLLKEYHSGRLPLYHFDLYRMDDPEEISALGFEDYIFDEGISVIEWADKAEGFWPHECLTVYMKNIYDTKRSMSFKAKGKRYRNMLYAFQQTAYGVKAHETGTGS